MTEKKQENGKFVRGALVLSVGGFLAKVVGAIYRIPLTNILGNEGIGLYQMVFPFYVLLLTISSSGIPSAISKVMSTRLKLGDFAGANKLFRVSMVSLGILGVVFSLFPVLFHNQIAAVLGEPRLATAFLLIAPSIFFVALISGYRGYFQGHMNMYPSAISQVVEQLIKAGFAIGFGLFFMPDVVRAVNYVILAVTLSELGAVLYLWLCYLRYSRRTKWFAENKTNYVPNGLIRFSQTENKNYLTTSGETVVPAMDRRFAQITTREALLAIYSVSIPVTLSALLLPFSQVIDCMMVVRMLTARHMNGTRLYGMLSGPVFSLISLPVVIAAGVATAVIPGLSGCEPGQKVAKGALGISLTLIVALPCTLFFILFAPEVVGFLYGRLGAQSVETIAKLLQLSALSVLCISLMQTAVSIMIAIGRIKMPLLFLAIGVAVKVILNYFLLQYSHLGIFGAGISSVACYFVAGFLDLYYIIRVMGKGWRLGRIIVKPFLATLVSGGIAFCVGLLPLGGILRLSLILLAFGISYGVLLFLFKIHAHSNYKES